MEQKEGHDKGVARIVFTRHHADQESQQTLCVVSLQCVPLKCVCYGPAKQPLVMCHLGHLVTLACMKERKVVT